MYKYLVTFNLTNYTGGYLFYRCEELKQICDYFDRQLFSRKKLENSHIEDLKIFYYDDITGFDYITVNTSELKDYLNYKKDDILEKGIQLAILTNEKFKKLANDENFDLTID